MVGDLDQRQATMLLVIRAEPAVVWAAVLDRRVELQRHLPGLERLAAELVILGVGADQHFLKPMLRTPLVQVDVAILDDDLGLDLAQAGRAEAVGQLEEDVGTIGHAQALCFKWYSSTSRGQ